MCAKWQTSKNELAQKMKKTARFWKNQAVLVVAGARNIEYLKQELPMLFCFSWSVIHWENQYYSSRGDYSGFFEKQGQVFFLGDLIQKNHTAPILAFFINAKALHRNRSGCVCDWPIERFFVTHHTTFSHRSHYFLSSDGMIVQYDLRKNNRKMWIHETPSDKDKALTFASAPLFIIGFLYQFDLH